MKIHLSFLFYSPIGPERKCIKMEEFIKNHFTVIGKPGSTESGDGFIPALWKDAESHFQEIAHLVKRNENGCPVGFWGAMSDMQMRFLPWEYDFQKGLYLAGAECRDDAEAPPDWTKWVIPGFRYLRTAVGKDYGITFSEGLSFLSQNHCDLVGAVQELTDPKNSISYLCFPIERL